VTPIHSALNFPKHPPFTPKKAIVTEMGDVGAQSSEKGKGSSEEQLNKPEKFLYAQFSVLNNVSQCSLLHIFSFMYWHGKRCQKPFFLENNMTASDAGDFPVRPLESLDDIFPSIGSETTHPKATSSTFSV
jgi:hypothetical protein